MSAKHAREDDREYHAELTQSITSGNRRSCRWGSFFPRRCRPGEDIEAIEATKCILRLRTGIAFSPHCAHFYGGFKRSNARHPPLSHGNCLLSRVPACRTPSMPADTVLLTDLVIGSRRRRGGGRGAPAAAIEEGKPLDIRKYEGDGVPAAQAAQRDSC